MNKIRYTPFIITLTLVFFYNCKNDSKILAINGKPIKPIEKNKNYKIENYPELSQQYVDSMAVLIDRFYKKNWASSTLNGSFLVAQNGQIIYEKYQGYANISEKKTITANTPLHIASVSKMITATAILKLISANKITLDQKLNTILPTFPFENVTIKNLLNHRSGLGNYTHFTDSKKIWGRVKILTNQDILNLYATKKVGLETRTDTHFSYSNTNYALLALVIEKITGQDYHTAMKSLIFDPLQMTDTYVFKYETDLQSATPSYRKNNQKYPMDFLDAVYGDKNIYSTPRDLYKLDLARHTIGYITPELDNQMYQGYSYESKGTKNYGLGIRMIEWENGQRFYFHNGWWHGNTASYISLGKINLTIICLSNKFNHATYKSKYVATLFEDYPFKIIDED
jgi:CubicO group peptidase (beta-lactamase class C family)